MTVQVTSNENQENVQKNNENKSNDKEYNFRALEARYEKQLATERAAREQAEKLAQEALARRNQDDDDDSDEPYVDKKRLEKKLAKFEEKTTQKTQSDIQRAVQQAIYEERKENWIKNNKDFFDVMQYADKLAERDPELAETILEMPEGFERQKLVYKNIKAFGLHQPENKKETIQDKIEANKRSPYYQPSGVAAAPYSGGAGDFSPQGQKQAYQKMQELKNKLRI
jgi:hypothetical protein